MGITRIIEKIGRIIVEREREGLQLDQRIWRERNRFGRRLEREWRSSYLKATSKTRDQLRLRETRGMTSYNARRDSTKVGRRFASDRERSKVSRPMRFNERHESWQQLAEKKKKQTELVVRASQATILKDIPEDPSSST